MSGGAVVTLDVVMVVSGGGVVVVPHVFCGGVAIVTLLSGGQVSSWRKVISAMYTQPSLVAGWKNRLTSVL